MGDFYMTLPSNSSTDVYPKNNAAQFQTKLPQTYHLNDYEVGLAEIQLPSAHASIKQQMFFLCHMYSAGSEIKIKKLKGSLHDPCSVRCEY